MSPASPVQRGCETCIWYLCLTDRSCEAFLARLRASAPQLTTSFDVYPTPASEVPRLKRYLTQIASRWPTEFIPLTNPTMACGLVIPVTLPSPQPDLDPSCQEVSTLVLGHIAKYWNLGHVVLREYMAILSCLTERTWSTNARFAVL